LGLGGTARIVFALLLGSELGLFALLLRGSFRRLALGLLGGLTRLFSGLARLCVAIGLRLLQNFHPLLRIQRQRRIREAGDEFLQHRRIGRVLDLVPLDRLLRGVAARRLLLRQSRDSDVGTGWRGRRGGRRRRRRS